MKGSGALSASRRKTAIWLDAFVPLIEDMEAQQG